MSDIRPSVADVAEAVDNLFLLSSASFVFMMQLGFAFVEAGLLREKNVINVLMKNVYDACFGVFVYWSLGYAFAFGDDWGGFVGTSQFFLIDTPLRMSAFFFFQFTFAATAATIVSGAVAERADFKGYVTYTLLLTGFVYPVASHWLWSEDGWLLALGYVDYAGSGAVHAVGGAAALSGCFMMGPRRGRYKKNKEGKLEIVDFPPHSVPFFILGLFVLWIGFLSFNGGSELRVSPSIDEETGEVVDHASKIAAVYINTMLSGAGGGLSALFVSFYLTGKWNLVDCGTGILAGMVAICGGVHLYEKWASAVIGFIGGILALFASKLLKEKLFIDDPVDAIPVHLVGGSWGVLCVGLFPREGVDSVFFTGNFLQLGYQIAGLLALVAWTGGLMLPIFALIKFAGCLRINKFYEAEGMDFVKHGHSAYDFGECSNRAGRRLSGDTAQKECQMSNSGAGSCAVEDLEQQAHSGSPVATPTGNSAEFKRGGSADFAPHRMVSPKGPALAKQGTSQAKVRNKRSISWVDQGELRNAQAILSSSESADVLQKGEDDPVVGSAPEGQPCAAAEEVSVSEGKDEWAVPEDEDFCLPGPGRVAVTGEGMHED